MTLKAGGGVQIFMQDNIEQFFKYLLKNHEGAVCQIKEKYYFVIMADFLSET